MTKGLGMANDISSAEQKNMRDLANLQKQYRERRNATVEQNESKLQDIKKHYFKKEKNIREASEAHINHIKTDYTEKIDGQEKHYRNKMAYDRQTLNKQLDKANSSGDKRIEHLQQNFKNREKQVEKDLKNLTSRESENREKQKVQTRKITQSENVRQQELQRDFSKSNRKLQKNYLNQQQKIRYKNDQEKISLNKEHNKHIKSTTTKNKKEIDNIMSTGNIANTNLKKQQRDQHDTEVKQHNQRINSVKDQGKKAVVDLKKENMEQINVQKKTTQTKLESESLRGTQNLEKVRGGYDKEIKKVNHRGKKEVALQNKLNAVRSKKLADHHTASLAEQKQLQTKELMVSKKQHEAKLSHNQKAYDKALYSQRSEFKESYKSNESLNLASLKQQKRSFLNAIKKQRLADMKTFGKYTDAAADPFYRHKDLNAKLVDSPNYYTIKVAVPEHEKDNLEILIQDQEVTVQGTRSFNENLNSGDNSRQFSSNSYETFREIISLDEPVVEKAVKKSYANGTLEIRVPKIVKRNSLA